MVVSAGNDGPSLDSINCPGNAEKALTIGAIDKENKITEFSSRGSENNPKPDLVAPGVITFGGFIASGTSISAPFVSGSLALLLSKINKERVVSALKQTAEDLNYERYEQGFGKIRVDKAWRLLYESHG